ncbi:MAG: nitroreductase family protein [Dehalococcoidales bacterium]
MKDLMEIIEARRSIRVYQDKALPKDVVKAILEAAKYAPTARNLQELEYKVITSKTLINKLSEGIAAALQKEGMPLKGPPGAKPDFFHGAPLLLIVTAPKDNYWASADAGLAAQNVMLYATSINLGSCFIGMAKLIERDKNLLKMLHIVDNMNIVAAVICGYPAENPAPREKKLTAEFFE